MQTAGIARRMERSNMKPSLLRTVLILTIAENDVKVLCQTNTPLLFQGVAVEEMGSTNY